MTIDLFDCVSPLDFRYYGADEKLRAELAPYVSEWSRLTAEMQVEVALARVLERRGVAPPGTADEIEAASGQVTGEEYLEEDRRINHETRALVNCLQRKVSPDARRFVHFTVTSFDIKDTAKAWRLKRVAQEVLLPDLKGFIGVLIEIALREKGTLQMGRTHGQHAVPITFGFALAGFVSRLGGRAEALDAAAQNLRGKISGAVGAYNASRLFFADPQDFEREVLAELGLEPSPSSTQIVEPEFVVDYLHALTSTLGVLADLADDMRHLQRTEISEVGEVFDPNQVGSSTMPHKRNPWNFENVKSFWKAFMPRMVTAYADQLSEHQRDLTNSATERFLMELVVAFVCVVRRLRRVMGRLVTDQARMRANFAWSADMVVAEPAYILLAAAGHPDAHEAIRRLTLASEQTGEPLVELVPQDEELRPYWERLTEEQRAVLSDPERYVGIAAEKTERLCREWQERLGLGQRA